MTTSSGQHLAGTFFSAIITYFFLTPLTHFIVLILFFDDDDDDGNADEDNVDWKKINQIAHEYSEYGKVFKAPHVKHMVVVHACIYTHKHKAHYTCAGKHMHTYTRSRKHTSALF